MKLVSVENLKTHFRTENGIAKAVDGVSFSIEEGESLGIVGESGCGKSQTAMSIMRLLHQTSAFHPDGKVWFKGENLFEKSESEMQNIRGHKIGMIFQEPMTALNPVYTIGDQVQESLLKHLKMPLPKAQKRVMELLERMGMINPDIIMRSYPHQLSGGMRQRVMIGMAVACRPDLLICDEPTTALDVSIQAQILNLLNDLRGESNTAIILITHDLGVVNQMCDNVMVMYSGKSCEYGTKEQILRHPRHPYTVKLMECIPRIGNRDAVLPVIPGMVRSATDFPEIGCRFAERCSYAKQYCFDKSPEHAMADGRRTINCFRHESTKEFFWDTQKKEMERVEFIRRDADKLMEIKNLHAHFPIKEGFFRLTKGYLKAVDDVSFDIPKGVTLAVVGESGCGKTTLGQSILRLIPEAQGGVYFDGENVLSIAPKKMRKKRSALQLIFQDPYGSLNPRMTVRQIIREGLRVHFPNESEKKHEERIYQVLADVGLRKEVVLNYPHEFSGGQRQRIAIARALALRPDFMVLDEATSALDVSVQAQVLNLLRELQIKYNLTYLFITHNIGVVSYIAHEVAVMYLGRIVEYGPSETVLGSPLHPYTRALIDAVPMVDFDKELPPPLIGDVPSPINRPMGCHFHPRCALRAQNLKSNAWALRCNKNYPDVSQVGDNHWVKCHGC